MMAPKKVTRDEKPKRRIVILEVKKESGTRLSDLAIQYPTNYYY
jgi:hypothetical protein